MKRFKRLGILVIVFVVVLGATVWLGNYEEKKEQIQNSDEIILSIDPDAVTSLSWEYEDTSFALHQGDGWVYDADEAFPVDGETVTQLLEIFQNFGASFIIQEPESLDQYGLEEPTCTIYISTEAQTYTIKLGDESKMDAQRYVDIGDGNVYLVSEDPFESYQLTLSDLIDHDEMPEFETVTLLTFQGTENYTIRSEEESTTYDEDDLYYTQDDKPVDPDLVTSYLNNITDLNPTDYVTYNATAEELTEYGMDDPELTVTVNYTYSVESDDGETEKDTFVLHISRNQEELAAAQEAEDGEETEISAYVRVGESQIVYQISQDAYNLLMEASYDDLRHQQIFWGDVEQITQVDVTLEGQEHTLVRETTEDEQTLWRFAGDTAQSQSEDETAATEETAATQEATQDTAETEPEEEDTLDLSAFQNALTALSADSFTDELPTDKEEIQVTLHLDNENVPEVTLTFYRDNGSQCLVQVDGKSTALVKRSTVMTLVEAVQEMVLGQ